MFEFLYRRKYRKANREDHKSDVKTVKFISHVLEKHSISSGRFLDVGSSTGGYLILLKKHFPELEITGLDISHRKNFEMGGVNFVKGSALEIPYPENSFEFCMESGLIMLLPARRALSEMNRILVHGELLLLETEFDEDMRFLHVPDYPAYVKAAKSLLKKHSTKGVKSLINTGNYIKNFPAYEKDYNEKIRSELKTVDPKTVFEYMGFEVVEKFRRKVVVENPEDEKEVEIPTKSYLCRKIGPPKELRKAEFIPDQIPRVDKVNSLTYS